MVWIFEELSASKITLTGGVSSGILKEIWTSHTKLEHMKHLATSHFRKYIGQMESLGFPGRPHSGKDGLLALVLGRVWLSKLGKVTKLSESQFIYPQEVGNNSYLQGCYSKTKWNNVCETTSPGFGTWPLLYYLTAIILLITILSHNYMSGIVRQDRSTTYDWLNLDKKSLQLPGKTEQEKFNLQCHCCNINS